MLSMCQSAGSCRPVKGWRAASLVRRDSDAEHDLDTSISDCERFGLKAGPADKDRRQENIP